MSKQGELILLRPGPSATLQDLGRSGIQHLGFCQGGAMDENAFLWANKLLGNTANAAALEITLGPFRCEFRSPTKIALTGAASHFYINDQSFSTWQSQWVNEGDILRFDMPRNGLRSYLAVSGGFNFQSAFDSATMVTRENSGPFDGQAFAPDQHLTFPLQALSQKLNTSTPWHCLPKYERSLQIKLIPTQKRCLFSEESFQQLLSSEYTITPSSNRMAYRLSGSAISANSHSLFSHAVPFGAVQIPPDGQPIILLKDRQTIGGYPVIGYVSQLDCFALSQTRPGEKVYFDLGNVEDCQEQLREFYRFFV